MGKIRIEHYKYVDLIGVQREKIEIIILHHGDLLKLGSRPEKRIELLENPGRGN